MVLVFCVMMMLTVTMPQRLSMTKPKLGWMISIKAQQDLQAVQVIVFSEKSEWHIQTDLDMFMRYM